MSRTRSKARRCAVQALYQRQMTGDEMDVVIAQFLDERDMAKTDVEYFGALLRGVAANLTELDEKLSPLVSRPLKDIDPVELAIVRLGAYELIHCLDVPYKVVINEALDATKMFGAEQGHRFVNGVLDKLSQQVRELEARRGARK